LAPISKTRSNSTDSGRQPKRGKLRPQSGGPLKVDSHFR
jgi:hypothetical protein